MRREKIFISLILVVMIVLLGTISSYAVEITASTSGSSNQTTITPANTTGNTIRPVNAAANSGNNVVNSTVNTYSNSGTVINTPTASSSNSNSLPYAGAGSIAGAFVVVVVLLGSSIFAYKKVSDYNV